MATSMVVVRYRPWIYLNIRCFDQESGSKYASPEEVQVRVPPEKNTITRSNDDTVDECGLSYWWPRKVSYPYVLNRFIISFFGFCSGPESPLSVMLDATAQLNLVFPRKLKQCTVVNTKPKG